MTSRVPYENSLKSYNSTSRRNKDRKKDREKERGKERDNEKENINQARKNINIGQSHNAQYEDIDYFQVNNNNNNNYNTHYNVENRNVVRKPDDIGSKSSKGYILNKPYGVWPFHSNKEINSYRNNKTEPKYYLGIYQDNLKKIKIFCTHFAQIFTRKPIDQKSIIIL